ncbi:MAG TPA: site-2 protease family protein [Opitutaceae bacterium]|nr:site-2 protease family protein [Opitutaceae bacterium]
MLGWSINLFRIRGIQLAVHVSFFLLLAYAANLGWREDGLTGLLWSIATLAACFTCVVLHELGHSFTAMHYGIRVRRILLMPIGGMAELDEMPRQPSRELWITVAGPAVNFVIAGILWALLGVPQGWPFGDFDYPATALGFAHLLLTWNLLMGVFNLVPVFPMDGGRILRAVLATRLPYLRATFWAASVGKVLAATGALVAIIGFDRPLTAVLFAFIFFAGEAEYRAARRREREEAEWREVLARAYARMPPPLEEPPYLHLRS